MARTGGDFDLPTPIIEVETGTRYSLGLQETQPIGGWHQPFAVKLGSAVVSAAALATFLNLVLPPPSAPIRFVSTGFDAPPLRTLTNRGEFSTLALLPTAGLPPGGHGDYPRFMPPLDDGAKKKKKPVRPIWDRGPQPPPAVETLKSAPEIVAPGSEPQALPSGPADISGLARLLDPPAPIRVEPPKRKARTETTAPAAITTLARCDFSEDADRGEGSGFVATYGHGVLLDEDRASARGCVDIAGRGLLFDTDIGLASAASLIRARFEAREDPDVLIAHATWDDDDIALALLMLADDNE